MNKKEIREWASEQSGKSYWRENAKLVLKLLQSTKVEKEDYITESILEQIVELFSDAYDSKGLIVWLEKNNWDPLNDIEYAEWRERSEFDTEEEWEEEKENALIADEENGILLVSW